MIRNIFTLFFACATTMASANSFSFKAEVTNKSNVAKVDEPVVISMSDISKLRFDATWAIVKSSGHEIIYQMDDMDGDSRCDELVFLTDIAAGEKKTFDITLYDGCPDSQHSQVVPKGKERIYTALQFRDRKDLHPNLSRVEAPGMTNIFNDIYMHGITVESDVVGYRIYFDERQNIDLYGKKYRRIELPVTQFYTTAEQLSQDYGVDVLWAGKAIGCGSFKPCVDGMPVNWLGSSVTTRGERIVASGPLRTVIEVYDLGMSQPSSRLGHSNEVYDVHQYYTLYAGHRDMKVDVEFSKPLHESISFCTGVQKVGVTATDSVRQGHKPEGMLRADGIVSSWGCDYPDMGKKQLWAPEAIGMAVYMPQQYICDSKEDSLNYIYVVRPKQQKLHYWLSFCRAKEDKGYSTANEWFASMDSWKESLTKPVEISIKME